MPGKTKTSKSNESYFKVYSYDKNKSKRIERHLKKHPNDNQAIERPKANYTKRRAK